MTTDTEALRAKFEAGATAAFGLSFDDDTPLKRYLWTAYQAGHADAKAETATAGAPLAMVQCHGSAEHPLYTADQLTAAVAAERERCLQIVESVDNYSNPMTANDCADAIRVERKKNLLPQTKES